MFKEFEKFLEDAVADSIELAVRDVVVPHIVEKVPRLKDGSRPPKPIKKSPDRPKRKKGANGRRPVQGYNGMWYAGVTGNLGRSIDAVRKGPVTKVGVLVGRDGRDKHQEKTDDNRYAMDYAEFLEFGTRYIAPFYFVTGGVHDQGQAEKILAKVEKNLKILLGKM